jgi:hypothetical protein
LATAGLQIKDEQANEVANPQHHGAGRELPRHDHAEATGMPVATGRRDRMSRCVDDFFGKSRQHMRQLFRGPVARAHEADGFRHREQAERQRHRCGTASEEHASPAPVRDDGGGKEPGVRASPSAEHPRAGLY